MLNLLELVAIHPRGGKDGRAFAVVKNAHDANPFNCTVADVRHMKNHRSAQYDKLILRAIEIALDAINDELHLEED